MHESLLLDMYTPLYSAFENRLADLSWNMQECETGSDRFSEPGFPEPLSVHYFVVRMLEILKLESVFRVVG